MFILPAAQAALGAYQMYQGQQMAKGLEQPSTEKPSEYADMLKLSRNRELEERTDYESESYLELINELGETSDRYELIGGYNYQGQSEKILQGLGFKREDFNNQTETFSGGWRMRIELAKILLRKPDLILLDEPTNHMDIESIQWLEDFLINSAKAVVVISHDRWFLDRICTHILAFEGNSEVYYFEGGFSEYEENKKKRLGGDLTPKRLKYRKLIRN